MPDRHETRIARDALHMPRLAPADESTLDLPEVYSLREEALSAPVPRGVLQAIEFMGCMASRRLRPAG